MHTRSRETVATLSCRTRYATPRSSAHPTSPPIRTARTPCASSPWRKRKPGGPTAPRSAGCTATQASAVMNLQIGRPIGSAHEGGWLSASLAVALRPREYLRHNVWTAVVDDGRGKVERRDPRLAREVPRTIFGAERHGSLDLGREGGGRRQRHTVFNGRRMRIAYGAELAEACASALPDPGKQGRWRPLRRANLDVATRQRSRDVSASLDLVEQNPAGRAMEDVVDLGSARARVDDVARRVLLQPRLVVLILVTKELCEHGGLPGGGKSWPLEWRPIVRSRGVVFHPRSPGFRLATFQYRRVGAPASLGPAPCP